VRLNSFLGVDKKREATIFQRVQEQIKLPKYFPTTCHIRTLIKSIKYELIIKFIP
jgi:hypothetical protein